MSVKIFIADVPEFASLRTAASSIEGCRLTGPAHGYWTLESKAHLEFARKQLGLGPALWNSCLSGGFVGTITRYDRELLRIESETSS